VSRLSTAGQSWLLRLARAAIHQALHADGMLEQALAEAEITPELAEPRAAFVSLKLGEKLRGCIGDLACSRPLYRAVIEIAPKTALEDPRFSPLAPHELSATRIEISVLGALRPLARPEDLVIGRHGVQLTRGDARAVFLPQVAAEQGWSVEQLLRELARKAGLGEESWRGAALEVFEADRFQDLRGG
jgi:AmmeMemoRadiSam system protein A